MSLRHVGRFWPVFIGLGGAAAWLGCNALAGIELGTLGASDAGNNGDGTVAMDGNAESGNGDSAGKPDGAANDAADSGSSSDGGGDSGDGAPGMDASAPTFVCAPSTRPFAVASLESSDGGRQFGGNGLVLGVTTDQEARIIVQISQNASGEAFRVYNVRWPGQLDSLWTFSGTNGLMNAQVTPTGITAILDSQSDSTAARSRPSWRSRYRRTSGISPACRSPFR